MNFEQLKRGLKKCADNPWRIFFYLSEHGLLNFLNDEAYLRLIYRASTGKKLNLKNPQTFNEKLQWLKLHNRKPEHTVMADKYLVRDYIAKTIGEEYLIPLLGVWDRAEDIDFDALPDQFVLKCNHNSTLGMCICKDKSKLDVEKVRAELNQGLRKDYYLTAREWPYKDIPRKIVCEKYMTDHGDLSENPLARTEGLTDYKFFCFNGVVKFFKIDFDRFTDHHANYYRPDGTLLPFGEADFPPKPERELPMPRNLNKMVELSEKLSQGHPFLRVDFYEINGMIYFGELTFFPATGMGKFTPPEWDQTIGAWLTL